MKHCMNCNLDYNNQVSYCTNCGCKLRKKTNYNNYILFFGVLLIIISSIAFGLFNWNIMNDNMKILFIFIEFLISFLIKYFYKNKNKKIFNTFDIISIIFIPLLLNMFLKYKLINTIISDNDYLMYIYLSISYLLTTIIFFISSKIYSNKLSTIFMNISLVISFYYLNHIKLNGISSFCISLLVILLLIQIFNRFINDLSIKKIYTILSDIIITYFAFSIYYYFINMNYNESIIIFGLYIVNSLIFLFNKSNYFIKYIMPYSLLIVSIIFLINVFDNNTNMIVILLLLFSMLYYYIFRIKNNKINNITMFFLNSILNVSLLSYYFFKDNNLMLLVTSIISNVFYISSYYISNNKKIIYLILFTFSIFIISLINYIDIFDKFFGFLFLSVLYFIIYNILKGNNKNNYNIFLYSSYALILIESILLLTYNEFTYWYILTLITIIYYFVMTFFFNNKNSQLILFILFIVLLQNCISLFITNLNYNFIIISNILFLILILISRLFKFNVKKYIYFSIFILLYSLIVFNIEKNLVKISLSILGYIISYKIIIEDSEEKNKNIYSIIISIIGLNYIYNIFKIMIDPIVISSLLTIFFDLVLIIVLYLLDRYNGKQSVIISLIVLLPYFTLIGNIDVDIKFQLCLLPVFLYIFIIGELINSKNKIIKNLIIFFIIMFLSLLCLRVYLIGVIFNLILSTLFIIISYYRNNKYLLTYSLVFLFINFVLSLYSLFKNIGLVIVLFIIGIVLIVFSIINEKSKNNKDA